MGDRLWSHRHPIMARWFAAAQEVIQFEETVIFYDLTHVYFCGDTENDRLHFGRSKEQRTNYRWVTLALTLDASGFPRSVEVLPGNVSEPETLKTALSQLGDQRPTVIMDAGIATKANLQWAQPARLWLALCRAHGDSAGAGGRSGPYPRDGQQHTHVWAWRRSAPKGEPRVYLHSEARHAVGSGILNRKRAKFEAALKDLQRGAVAAPQAEAVRPRAAQGRSLGSAAQAGRVPVSDPRLENGQGPACHGGHLHAPERARRAHRGAGGYVLRTSHAHWSLDEILSTYWSLAEIKRTFRSLKSELGLRPFHHRLTGRIQAHLLITVLAYHMVQYFRLRLQAHGITKRWSTLRTELESWMRVTTELTEHSGAITTTRRDTELSDELNHIADILDIDPASYHVQTRAKPGRKRPARITMNEM